MDRPDFTSSSPLAITHTRGPMNPRTWTGVPLTMIKTLQAMGVAAHGIDSGIKSTPTKLMLGTRSMLAGYGPLYFRARPARAMSAAIVQQQARALGCRTILHCGTLDLPMEQTDDLLHVMYTDTTWDMWHGDSRYRFLTKRLHRHTEDLDREAYRQLDHIFLFSQYVRGRMIDRYGVPPEKITVVGSGRGPGLKPFDGEKNYQSNLILFVARHRFLEKGGELLLKAFEKVRQTRPELNLVILGNDAILKRTRGFANVEVKGRIPLEELQRLYEQAALFVMPALMEPWGQVYLEALTCKTPTLALNRFAYPELCGNGRFGFIIDQPEPDAVARGIIDALSDPARLSGMGTEGQKFAVEFTWERVMRRILDGISQLQRARNGTK